MAEKSSVRDWKIARSLPVEGREEQLIVYNPKEPLTGKFRMAIVQDDEGNCFAMQVKAGKDGEIVFRYPKGCTIPGPKTFRVKADDANPKFRLRGVIIGDLV